MRSAALNPGELKQATLVGIAEMRGLLSPAECQELLPPDDIAWATSEANDTTGRSWSHSPQYRFGEQMSAVSPSVQTFLGDFRDLIQTNAKKADIPELTEWGTAIHADHPVELLGFQRSAYAAKWHRTPADHQIGWHSDDTFEEARGKREFGVRALGLMIAISLTEHGGTYEWAPASAETYPGTSVPSNLSQVLSIQDIRQGDAIAFCTARNSRGEQWPGSFPLHRFIADESAGTEIWRDSLVVTFQDVSARSLRTIGIKGILEAAKARIPRLY